jgi:hypothetical protein
MIHIKTRLGSLAVLAAVIGVVAFGTAQAFASSAPTVITYKKTCVVATGHYHGDTGDGGTIDMQVTGFAATETIGNWWQIRSAGSRENKPKPLPPVAAGCRSERMVSVVPIRPPSCQRGGHLPRSAKRIEAREPEGGQNPSATLTVDLRVGRAAVAAVPFEFQGSLAENALAICRGVHRGAVSYALSSIARACLSQFANSFGSMSLSSRSLTWAMTFPDVSSRPDGSSIEAPCQNPSVTCFDAALR